MVWKWIGSYNQREMLSPLALLPPEAKMNVLSASVTDKLYRMSPPQPQCLPHDDDGLYLAHRGKHIPSIEHL